MAACKMTKSRIQFLKTPSYLKINGIRIYLHVILIQGLFVGYYGGNGHQPRLLGSGLVAMALGMLCMSMAHFAAPPYQPAMGSSLVCDSTFSKYIMLYLLFTITTFIF